MKHAVKESERCQVSGCGKDAERSLPADKVRGALKDLKFETDGRRISLCKEHYKQYKKETRDERKLEKTYW